MKTLKKATTPAREYDEGHTTCDRCGNPCGEDEQGSTMYDVRKVELELKSGHKLGLVIGEPGGQLHITNVSKVKIEGQEGTNYPEGSNIDTTIIDCCVACFEAHVLPALKALGFNPRYENRSW